MVSEENVTTDGSIRDASTLGGVNRRTVLKASAATGASGMLAGCSSGLLGGGSAAANPEACPTITGVEDGFLWVQKTVGGSYPELWEMTVARPSDEELTPGDSEYGYGDSGGVDVRSTELRGSGRIGNGEVEFHEAGTFTFQYMADNQDNTWVEKPRDLMSVVFPAEKFEQTGVIQSEDIVAGGVYPYTPGEPMALDFEIEEPGRYRIAYGPGDGIFLFEEWLPNPRERSTHMRLGLNIQGDESAYTWGYPELPEHVSVWIGREEVVLSRELHANEVVECDFDMSQYQ